ncbi:MAG: HAMP domain-containing histidine kinase [Bacteroidaceae bacterium]|nr:HAMP domain-containing histidine kinase [Bacteroidaceae bacterium]
MKLFRNSYIIKTILLVLMLTGTPLLHAQSDSLQADSIDDTAALAAMAAQNAAWLEQERMEKEEILADRKWNYALTAFVIFVALVFIIIYYYRSKSLQKVRIHNQELIISLEQAERASQIKTVFIQNMSHEIRTPLNAICGFAQILSDPVMSTLLDDAEKEEYRRIITNNTSFLSVLIDDILDISELKTGRYKMNIAACSLHDICQDSMDLVKLQVPEGVQLVYNNPLRKDFTINTDYYRTKQVLSNLLTNACHHTKQGTIALNVESMANGVRFIVEDTGNGVDPSKAEEIFDSYSRIDTYRQGSGLGLTICRNIANALKGRVYLDTSYTTGARFVFEI